MGVEWVLLATVFVAFAVGVYVGCRLYRWRLFRSVQLPPVPAEAEIDHDAMFRILEQWGHR
jgi:hypothetical protein